MDASLRLVETIDDCDGLRRWLGERRPALAVDTETGGFDWWREPLRLVQLGDAETGWAVPFHDWGGAVKELLPEYEGPLVFQNAKFDLLFLERNGVEVPSRRVEDTRLMAHLMDPGKRTSLKDTADRLLSVDSSAGERALKQAFHDKGWDWRTVPTGLRAYWSYAALDAVLTARLAEEMLPQVRERFSGLYELELATQQLLMEMEQRGVRVDLDYLGPARHRLLDEARQLRDRARDNHGVKNLTSRDQVIEVLQRDGWVPEVLTDAGKPSLRKEVLATIDHPLARMTLEVRHLEKMVGSYFDAFLNFADGDLLHAKINPLGARTGRMSVSEPSLQNLPRDDYVVRDAFVPRDGNRLLTVDFDQIEMRLLAHFAREDALVAALQSGADIFTAMARRIYQDDSIEKKDRRRQITKNASYAKIYGAGVGKFAQTAGVPEAQAQQFLNAYDAAYPRVRAFQDEVEQVAEARAAAEGVAYVRSPAGRWHPAGRGEEYKLVNYLVQGTAADVLKQKLVELDRAGLGDYVVLPVHDEVIFDVPTDEVEEVRRAAVEVLEDRETWRAPLTVSADVLERWGTKYR